MKRKRIGILSSGKAVYRDGKRYQVKELGVSFLEDPTPEEMVEIDMIQNGMMGVNHARSSRTGMERISQNVRDQ